MCRGKDVGSGLLAFLIAATSLGCIPAHRPLAPTPSARTPAVSPAAGRVRPLEPTGPVALADPRPVQSTPPPAPPQPLPPPAPTGGPEIPTATQTPPAAPSPSIDPLADVRRLQRTAAERYAGIDSFIARLRRREWVNGKMSPEETIRFSFRKNPFSIHFKWLSDPGKGREVVYVKGKFGDNLHTLTANGDVPLMRGGMRLALAPNDPRVLARSRYPITEAGLGPGIDRLGQVIAALDRGDRKLGVLTYLGQQARPEYPTPLEGIDLVIPPGGDPHLLRGGRRIYYFDPGSGLPVIVITTDEKGQEVEYYCFDRFSLNVKLDDDDFNPDKLWRKP